MIFSRIIAFFLICMLLPVYFVLGLFILLSAGRPIFFKQKRIGVDNTIFYLYKFRTMKIDTPDVATHLLASPGLYYIKFGLFFRKLVRNTIGKHPHTSRWIRMSRTHGNPVLLLSRIMLFLCTPCRPKFASLHYHRCELSLQNGPLCLSQSIVLSIFLKRTGTTRVNSLVQRFRGIAILWR